MHKSNLYQYASLQYRLHFKVFKCVVLIFSSLYGLHWLSVALSGSLMLSKSPCMSHKALVQLLAALLRHYIFFLLQVYVRWPGVAAATLLDFTDRSRINDFYINLLQKTHHIHYVMVGKKIVGQSQRYCSRKNFLRLTASSGGRIGGYFMFF